jgi:hypothetical protein
VDAIAVGVQILCCAQAKSVVWSRKSAQFARQRELDTETKGQPKLTGAMAWDATSMRGVARLRTISFSVVIRCHKRALIDTISEARPRMCFDRSCRSGQGPTAHPGMHCGRSRAVGSLALLRPLCYLRQFSSATTASTTAATAKRSAANWATTLAFLRFC